MAKASLIISGIPESIKVDKDGVAELIFKIDSSQAVPKGLKYLGASNYVVNIGSKAWRKAEKEYTTGDKELKIFRIEGEPKASVTQKGVPYIRVVAFSIQVFERALKEPKEKSLNIAPVVVKEEKEVKEVKVTVVEKERTPKEPSNEIVGNSMESAVPGKKLINEWANIPEIREKLVELDVNLIDITEEDHLKAGRIDFAKSRLNRVVIRPLDNGRYSLTIGIKAYINAKIYDNSVFAYIYDGDKEAFCNEFDLLNMVYENKPFPKKKGRNKRKSK